MKRKLIFSGVLFFLGITTGTVFNLTANNRPAPQVSTAATIGPTSTTTPTISPVLGGLDLDSYCKFWEGKSGAQVKNNIWFCAAGGQIDMKAACQWQYTRLDVSAEESIPGNVYSWVCTINYPTPSTGYGSTPIPQYSSTPTVMISPTSPTITPSMGSTTPTITGNPGNICADLKVFVASHCQN